jgi:hypothetical protein
MNDVVTAGMYVPSAPQLSRRNSCDYDILPKQRQDRYKSPLAPRGHYDDALMRLKSLDVRANDFRSVKRPVVFAPLAQRNPFSF